MTIDWNKYKSDSSYRSSIINLLGLTQKSKAAIGPNVQTYLTLLDNADAEEVRRKLADEHVASNYGARAWGNVLGTHLLAGTAITPFLLSPVTALAATAGGVGGEKLWNKGYSLTGRNWNKDVGSAVDSYNRNVPSSLLLDDYLKSLITPMLNPGAFIGGYAGSKASSYVKSLSRNIPIREGEYYRVVNGPEAIDHARSTGFIEGRNYPVPFFLKELLFRTPRKVPTKTTHQWGNLKSTSIEPADRVIVGSDKTSEWRNVDIMGNEGIGLPGEMTPFYNGQKAPSSDFYYYEPAGRFWPMNKFWRKQSF